MVFESLLLKEAYTMISDLSSFLQPVEPFLDLYNFMFLPLLRLDQLLGFHGKLYHVIRFFIDM